MFESLRDREMIDVPQNNNENNNNNDQDEELNLLSN